MQLMIDITQETPEALDLASKFLADHAALKRAMERGDHGLGLNAASVNVPAGTTPPVPVAPSAPVVPFAPPAPPAPPAAATPIAPVAPPAPPAPPAASISSAPVLTATTTTAGLKADEYDSAGMPWDARIHQKAKSQKKDGTWKLQKNIDQGLVAQVMQEMHAQGRIRNPAAAPTAPSAEPNPTQVFGHTPLPVGASAPVPLPPPPPAFQGYQAGQLPPPPPAPGAEAQAQSQAQGVPPPPPPQAPVSLQGHPPVSVPPAPTVGVPNVGGPPVLPPPTGAITDFRSLVEKITRARTAGRLTPEHVSGALAQAGAPSLQALGALSHLVPIVDAYIDAALAMG